MNTELKHIAGSETSLVTRVRHTFVAPSRLAAEVRERAPWVDVLIISTIVALVSIAFVPDEVFTAPMQDPVNRMGEPVTVTSSPETIAFWGRALGMMSTLVTHPLVAITLAGMLTLLYTVLGRGRAHFPQYLSLVSHALLIPALGTVVSIGVRVASGGAGWFGIGAADGAGEAQSLLQAMFLSLDPFIIWMLVVVAIGVRTLGGARSTSRAAAVLVGAYLVFALASTALLHPELRGAPLPAAQVL